MTMQTSRIFGRSLSVAHALERGGNNFDFFRLVAALVVIYGHSFATAPKSGSYELLSSITGYYSQTVAVMFFFFLSGLLVTNSILQRQSTSHFLISRFFRIWPALVFVVLSVALVVGPIVTSLDSASYFSNQDTFLYIKNQVIMNTWNNRGLGYFELPGVFVNNHYKGDVNVSLWTLAAEVYAYLFLVASFMVFSKSRMIITIILLLIIIDSILPFRVIFTFLAIGNKDYSLLPFCFSIGALLALYKERIIISSLLPIGFCLFYFLLNNTVYREPLFYVSVFFLILYLATRQFVVRYLKLPGDYSYGIYLWGWPIQQLLAYYFPNLTGMTHCIFAMLLAGLAGFLSWFLVEKRFITIGKRASKACSRFESNQNA